MDSLTPALQCDIELQFKGRNIISLNRQAADLLRRLADQIERDEFAYGHHPITDLSGRLVGSVFIDYSGERT